ncbi:ribonuclease H-like domain-containing protein [Tanacetum coccineum]
MKSSNESANVFNKDDQNIKELSESEVNTLNLFDVQRSERPYDEERDPSNVKEESVTYEDNVQNNSNGEDPSNVLKTSPVLRSKNGLFIAILVYVDDIMVTGNNEVEIDKFKRKYFLELLYEYGLLACNPVATPLQQKVVLSHTESNNDKFLTDMSEYQKIVGKLIYLSIIRHAVSYVVYCLSQHMHALL